MAPMTCEIDLCTGYAVFSASLFGGPGALCSKHMKTWQQQQQQQQLGEAAVRKQNDRSCIECGKLSPPWKPKSAVCGPCRDKIKDYLFNTYYRGPGTWRLEDRKPEMAATACPLCNGPREITPDGNVVCRSRDCNKNLMFAEHYGAKAEDIFVALRDVSPNVEDIYTTEIVNRESTKLFKFVSFESGSYGNMFTNVGAKCQCGSDAAGSPRHSDWCQKFSRAGG